MQKGYGYNKIARVLTERKVITPAAYQAQQAGREYPKDPYEWNLTTVWKMFENQTYLGHLVSGKRRKASFKSKRIVKQDEDQWIVVKDMFAELRIKLTQQDETIQDVQNFINLAETYREVTELDTDLLNHLVSKIVVGERVKDGADVVQKITVHYKFIGAL